MVDPRPNCQGNSYASSCSPPIKEQEELEREQKLYMATEGLHPFCYLCKYKIFSDWILLPSDKRKEVLDFIQFLKERGK